MLLSCRALGNTKEIRLAQVNVVIKQWYDDYPGTHRMPPIKMNNTVLNGWWELHGPTVKAAATRAAAPVFSYLAGRYFPTGSPLDVALRGVTAGLADFYDTLYSEPMFMGREALERFAAVTVGFGEHYQALRQLCLGRNIFAFQVTPKVHKLQHFPMLAEIVNPRFCQVYAEESQIGTTTRCWKRSMAGRYRAHIQRNVLLKRLLGLVLRFEP